MSPQSQSISDDHYLQGIDSIAEKLGLSRNDYESYGRGKAKLVQGLEQKLSGRPLAKYIGVTAMNPTPLG